MSAITVASLLLAPARGVLWRRWRERRDRRTLAAEAVLLDLYELARQHEDPGHPHSTAVLESMEQARGIERVLDELAERGWARREGVDQWALTPEGVDAAQRLLTSPRGGESASEAGTAAPVV
jgi:manganese/zinc/iron transport system permease protein